jgi:hypothetical protein
MKLKIPQTRARNALVPAALFRHAGRHSKSAGAQRLQAQRNLRREVLQTTDNDNPSLPNRLPDRLPDRQAPSKWRTPEP